jgi:hypothetical protein
MKLRRPRYTVFSGGGNWIPLLLFVLLISIALIVVLLVTT